MMEASNLSLAVALQTLSMLRSDNPKSLVKHPQSLQVYVHISRQAVMLEEHNPDT